MIVIYFKSDGEIWQVAFGYDSFEGYFGNRADEFGQIFDCLIIEENDYIFNKFQDFMVDIEGKQLVLKNLEMYNIIQNTQKFNLAKE